VVPNCRLLQIQAFCQTAGTAGMMVEIQPNVRPHRIPNPAGLVLTSSWSPRHRPVCMPCFLCPKDRPPHPAAAMSFTHFVKTYELQNDKVLLPKKQLVTYALYALIAVALLYLFFFEPAPPAVAAQKQELPPSFPLPYQRDETLMRSASRQGNKTVQ
jgi:hypothetical protein